MKLNPFPNFHKRHHELTAKKFPSINWVMLACTVALLIIGVLFIKSACAIRTDSVRYLYLQMIYKWIPAGMVAHFVIAKIDYRRWIDWVWIVYAAAIFALVLVLIPGIGTEQLGARRWLFGLQPSEFAKLIVIPTMVFFVARSNIENGAAKLWVTILVAAVPAVLIMLQPDLGSAIVLVPTALGILFVAGCAPRMLTALVLSAVIFASVFVGAILLPERLPEAKRERVERVTDKVIFPHWKKRILVFAHPERDPLGAGWNKRQSEIAVGSGGTWGKGYLKGTQNILGFLPRAVASTDFIYSVIAEETGFAGSLVLLCLFGGLLGSIAFTGIFCRDAAGRLVCTGVAVLLFTHIFVNVAMTIGKMPITGIPLPLISYGGSFTISTLALLGLVQSVAIHGNTPEGGH